MTHWVAPSTMPPNALESSGSPMTLPQLRSASTLASRNWPALHDEIAHTLDSGVARRRYILGTGIPFPAPQFIHQVELQFRSRARHSKGTGSCRTQQPECVGLENLCYG